MKFLAGIQGWLDWLVDRTVDALAGDVDAQRQAVHDTIAEQSEADAILCVDAAVERLASTVTDAICHAKPDLDGERVHRALATELWMVVQEHSHCARVGVYLS